MRDGSKVGSLERPRRRRPRIRLSLGWLVAALLGLALVDRPEPLTCAQAAPTSEAAVLACHAEYVDTGDPATGVRLANALQANATGPGVERDAAKLLATALLGTSQRAGALRVLGKIAATEGRLDDAQTALTAAREQHLAQGEPGEVARDDQVQARVLVERNQFAESLLALDDCLAKARDAEDRGIAYYCRISAVKVLYAIGYIELAEQEIARARPLASTVQEHAWLKFQEGNIEQEYGHARNRGHHQRQAISDFEQALVLAQRAEDGRLVHSLELNLVYSLAEVGALDDAERYLANARAEAADDDDELLNQAAARIAYRRGNGALASALNERIYPRITDHDERFGVATMQARIALDDGDLARAELWARRGVEQVEAVRGQQSALELRAWVLPRRSEAFELLFVALARAGRIEDAAMVIDEWQGRTMLDAMTRPQPLTDLRGAAGQVRALGAWLTVMAGAPFGKPPERRAVLDTLHATDLLALVIANDDVWCLTASQGRLQVANLGAWHALESRIDLLSSDPTDRAVASELGELILRDGAFRSTGAALHVLLAGPLAKLPIVALRRGGRPLIAVRPVVRELRLPEAACVTVRPRARLSAIGDAAGDLPDARREVEELSGLPGATIAVGSAATRAALFEAMRSDVLHVAVHAELDASGGVLKLSGQDVSALDISRSGLGPSLVVLSACGSADAKDEELAGALATAFLEAGSIQVVATPRPVHDARARELASRFYRAGGIADPVGALAKVQAELADTDDGDWASFAVFGHDVCPAVR